MRAEDFSEIAWTMAGVSSGCKPQYPSIWNTPGRNLLQHRIRYKQMSRANGIYSETFRKTMSLQPLLRSFSISKCSLMHDRVYGLLGIAIDTGHSAWPIRPDYGRAPAGLLLDVLQNQRRRESDAPGDTWRLIRSIGKLLDLGDDELFATAFHNAPKTERQLHILMSVLREHNPYDRYGQAVWDDIRVGYNIPTLSFYQRSSSTLKSCIELMRRLKGCMISLRAYLDSCPLEEARVPSYSASIDALIVGLRRTKEMASAEEASRSQGMDTYDAGEQLSQHGQRMFEISTYVIGFTHKSLSTCTWRDSISAVSYHSFGEYGTALLLTCGEDCHDSTCMYPDYLHRPKVVGTAFFFDVAMEISGRRSSNKHSNGIIGIIQ